MNFLRKKIFNTTVFIFIFFFIYIISAFSLYIFSAILLMNNKISNVKIIKNYQINFYNQLGYRKIWQTQKECVEFDEDLIFKPKNGKCFFNNPEFFTELNFDSSGRVSGNNFDNNDKGIAVIGDSHATHISQTVIDVAANRFWNTAVWTKGSCAIQFKQSFKKSLSDRCIEQNMDILGWAQKQKPSMIIVSQFVKADSSQIDLRDALATLRLITPNVLLIENTPVFPDKSRFMVRLPLLFPRYYPPKSFPQSKMVVTDKFASDELGEWARENQITTMDLSPLFCSNDLCNRFSDAGWLYFDDDHLSLEGAKLSANLFDDYFENILQK
jgi:hypothetical protein